MVERLGPKSLFKAIVQPRRRVKGHLFYLRIFDTVDCGSLFRWDARYIVPANESTVIRITRVHEIIRVTPKTQLQLVEKGDTLILNNWRMLHGRGEIPFHCSSRRTEPAYLEELR
jgi:L-asparagine oxygenase